MLLQSFSEPSLRIFAATLGTKLPIHFLVGARDAAPWLTADGLTKLKTFATGISPEKVIVVQQPEAMARARQMGLLITPYTFRASAVTGFPDVRAEMAHYLQQFGVDGVITDNPDLMPPSRREPAPRDRSPFAPGVRRIAAIVFEYSPNGFQPAATEFACGC